MNSESGGQLPEFLAWLLAFANCFTSRKCLAPCIVVLGLVSSASVASGQDLGEDETLRLLNDAARGIQLNEEQFPPVLVAFEKYLEKSLYREQPEMQLLINSLRNMPATRIGPGENEQFNAFENQRAAFGMVYATFHSHSEAADQVEAHPSAALFPGEVTENGSSTPVEFHLDTTQIGWVSTDLYAPPGQPIEVSIPESIIEEGWLLRIGAHNNSIPLTQTSAFTRFHCIDRVVALNETSIQVTSPFGGLIYFQKPVPEQVSEDRYDLVDPEATFVKPTPNFRPISITGAIAAPSYWLNQTSNTTWKSAIQKSSAPWAEIGSDRIVFTLPTETLKQVENPDVLIKKWDQFVYALNRFAGRADENPMAIRVVMDVALPRPRPVPGYPIVVPMEFGQDIVSPEDPIQLVRVIAACFEPKGAEFQGSGELNIRLLGLFAMMRGLEITSFRMSETHLRKMIADRLEREPKDRSWSGGKYVWERLALYSLLVEEFGWEPFHQVFKESTLNPIGTKKSSEEEKAGEFLLRFCRIVDKNVSPLFVEWGVELDQSTLEKAKQFPEWKSERYLQLSQ